MTLLLPELLELSARRYPDRIAVEESHEGHIRFAELDRLANRVRDRLVRLGVCRQDRVGMCLPKSADAVAVLFGIMKAGAAYVPVDPTAPAIRNAYIFENCGVKAIFVDASRQEEHAAEFRKTGFAPAQVRVDGIGGGIPLGQALDRLDADDPAPAAASPSVGPSHLAYILYTSGSTGRPKGVMLSHGNAGCFVDWCSEVFQPTENDRFSSHAPFHFDLSILDIYVAIKHAATLVIVDEALGKDPARLAPWIADKKLTVWYSAPSILGLMAQFGKLDQQDCSSLRMVLFAGEVFPIKHLRLLKSLWRHPRYFNLYGPTETNVCTYYEVPPVVPDDRNEPYPIGKTCSHLESLVIDPDGREVPRGELGELLIRGPSVTEGYWNLPEQTAAAFFSDAAGRKWYRTGDLTYEDPSGDFIFRGRRDRMIKKRGYRVELGEIEACLYRHPLVRQAAVISQESDDSVKVKAFVCPREGERLSLIDLKKFCSQHLPLYMVPDLFAFPAKLPTTSTDKVDYVRLREMN